MKVYCWKTLIVTILIGGWSIISKFKKLIGGELSSIFSILFWSYVVFKGLWVSLTKEGFELDMRRGTLRKKAIKKLFGSWAYIVPYGGLILIMLSVVCVKLIPSHVWIAILLFFLGLVYFIVVEILIGKYVKMEKKEYL